MDSAKISRNFYKNLTAYGLKTRTSPAGDKEIIAQLEQSVSKDDRILDLACGYGRITIPLAQDGYRIEGIDLSPNLIKDARTAAAKGGLRIRFRVGNMTSLPFQDDTFTAIFCIWSAFHELITKNEQLAAIKEMERVLQPGGFTLIEGSVPEKRRGLAFSGKGKRIKTSIIEGQKNLHYQHDKRTYTALMRTAKISKFRVFVMPFGGRDRQCLRFEKT